MPKSLAELKDTPVSNYMQDVSLTYSYICEGFIIFNMRKLK